MLASLEWRIPALRHVNDAASEIDPASNATDDSMISVLEDQPDDPVLACLVVE